MTKRINRMAVAVVAALISFMPCLARESGTTFVKEALEPYLKTGELPGAISIFDNNGVRETAIVGYADVASRRPMTFDSLFMQCSQTKGFCGVTVAMLVEEGKLSLDDPVSKYLPEFKELWIQTSNAKGVRTLTKAKNELTVRMVMNHTSGFPFELPNYEAMGGWSRRMPLRSVAAVAATLPLQFEPGTKGLYSNVGIDIGAAIVEVISGMRWEAFLKKRVLVPLGMNNTTFWPTKKQLTDRIELYEAVAGKPAKWIKDRSSMQCPYGDDRVFSSAAAGLWTTVNDQLKFYRMLMNLGKGDNGVRILKEDTVKTILAVSTRPKGMSGYSLGLSAPIEDGENAWIGHGGAWGTSCMVNWHKRQMKLLLVQVAGRPTPWEKAHRVAADKFFAAQIDSAGVDAYTRRMK
ncbi:MAG: beta-lactamase family protein [Kiritimatiellae bacterium]|nr:beta-lactamase family protein [Kiritimatiellia bacterium]